MALYLVRHMAARGSIVLALKQVLTKAAVDGSEAERMPHWTMHDFRRSGVTWLAGAGFAPDVADTLLNHTQGTIKGVAAIYQRGEFAEERKRARDAWGAHVLASAEGKSAADVVADLAARRCARP